MEGSEHQEASGFSGLTSMTSSISSPVDSGVALLDSDADVTSVNETTVTDADVLSLREEDTNLPELDDNHQLCHHINNYISSQEKVRVPVEETCQELFQERHTNYEEIDENIVTKLHDEDYDCCGGSSDIGDTQQVITCSDIYDINQGAFESHCATTHEIKSASTEVPNEKVSVNERNPNKMDLKLTDRIEEGSSQRHDSCNKSLILNSMCKPSEKNNDRMSKSCMSFIEDKSSNEYISTVENFNSVESLVDNKWCSDTDAMSTSLSSENIVIRRQRKKKCSGPDSKVKRVSFHDDFVAKYPKTTGFSASFLPPNPVIKCDVVKGRYSWCAEGDAPFIELRKSENDTKSDVYLSSSIIPSVKEIPYSNTSKICATKEKLISEKTCSKDIEGNSESFKSSQMKIGNTKGPPVAERGTPEGQEDPPKTSSLLHLNSITDSVLTKFPSMASSIDWSSDTESEFCDRHLTRNKLPSLSTLRKEPLAVPQKFQSISHKMSALMLTSKTSLLNKFMRSLTEKKFVQRKVKLQNLRPLYIPYVKPDPATTCQSNADVEAARAQIACLAEQRTAFGAAFENTMKTRIFRNSNENVYKVFKVNSSYFLDGKSKPLLIVLSGSGLYFVGLKNNFTYFLQLMILYSELDAIIVGPNQQTLMFISVKQEKQILVTSNNSSITRQVVGFVEMAVRKLPVKSPLPAISQLQLEDMKLLKTQLTNSIPLLEDEVLYHYSIVHMQDNPTSPPSTPLGPNKEGHLMFRPATSSPLQPWEPGYFILKGGVVYMFSDQDNRLPKRVIPLHAGHCQGCRRMVQETRPHTFEIVLGYNRSFQFAAADDYEVSEWLQALVQSASGFYEADHLNTTSCSLIITSQHIITCQEKYPSGKISVLTCAAITDLASYNIATLEGSWCILEFVCHEVHESSGDWALFFPTHTQMSLFKDDLENRWNDLMQVEFPVCEVLNDRVRLRCEETSQHLSLAWNDMNVVDQQK